ncbi:hypothetical protein [Aeromonas veronii]|uniref:hypothetical protein n=1 Tax=Aeromonas veronii TaxID=654 RepID=UPI003B9DD37C
MPYKQSLNSISFTVSVNPTNTRVSHHYGAYNEIAFLVSDWIKIQDSLEMIFNLLCGSHKKSICMLAYLRENNISALEFALYLNVRHNFIFINRFCSGGNRNLPKTIGLINYLQGGFEVHVLMVGTRDSKGLSGASDEFGCCIHPSGVNLNLHSVNYYNLWYLLDNNYVSNKTAGFDISNFSVLK